MNFRSDLNGVRALAVLPVLFFHARLPLFSGGFLGVDVFFVISGYLITEKLFASFVSGKFSFANFYDNRIRRIIPALLVVSACTTALSFLFMVPYSLRNYGESLVATMLSANNILLYLTSGYWSVAAEFKPLYHTWSLGVEEQYYFVAPLLLYFLYRNIGHRDAAMRGIVLFILALSFILTLVASDKEFKFLIIFFRAWELGAPPRVGRPAKLSQRQCPTVPLCLLSLRWNAVDSAVDARAVVINPESRELSFEVKLVPKHYLVQQLFPSRPDHAFNERMRKRGVWNRLDLLDAEYA